MLFNLQPSDLLCYLTVGDIPERGVSLLLVLRLATLVFGLVNFSSPFVGWVNGYFDFFRIMGFLLNFAHLGTKMCLFQVSFDAINFVWILNPNFRLMRNPVYVRNVVYAYSYLWCFESSSVFRFYALIQSAQICKIKKANQ